MAHGGARKGAGRPRGQKVVRSSKAAIKKATDGGLLPLEVLIDRMRAEYKQGDYDKAVAIAVQAAPYLHPKLANVQHGGDKDNPLTFTIVTNVERDEPQIIDAQPLPELEHVEDDGKRH